jgi:diguanylate cyclase (GGDEF)-like protein/PAS domain S-box-containing protein
MEVRCKDDPIIYYLQDFDKHPGVNRGLVRGRLFSFLVALFFSFFITEGIPPVFATETVTLQLKGSHQFQFAGYYAAIEKGYYQAVGLDVKLREAHPGEDPIAAVLKRKAEFGVGTSELVLWRSWGWPVVVLAVIFQHSPVVLLARKESNIQSLHDLQGKRVMMEPNLVELFAYLKREKISVDQLDLRPHTFNPSEIINGQIDAMSAYSTHEPFILQQAGIEYYIFSPRSGGIDFYGDNLFTTEEQIQQNPKRVQAFLDASLSGWRYAMEHPEEVINLILLRYSRRKSREHLLFEAEEMRRLIVPDLVEIGYMYPGRWKHMVDTYTELGMLKPGFSLRGFLYNQNSGLNLSWFHLIAGGTIILIMVISVALIRFYKLNQALRVQIREREMAEANLRASEAQYRILVEAAPFPVVIINLKNNESLYMNPKALQLLGIEKEQRVRKLMDYWEDLRKYSDFLGILKRQGHVYDFEVRFKTEFNKPFVVSVSAVRMTYQNEPAVFVAFKDITKQKHLENELRRLASIDILTGTYNRRRFMELAKLEEERCRRYGHPLSILMMDIDHFKQINDTFGHAAGDEVLRQFALTCSTVLRQHDVLGRLGGEEFAAFLPETGIEGARITAERLRITVANLRIPWNTQTLQFTISVGVTSLHNQENFDAALHRADQALYEAKAKGRNRVIVRE